MFSQQLGPALFLSLAQTILSSTLKSQLPTSVPGVNTKAEAQRILDAGATGFRNVVSMGQVQGVASVYCEVVDRVFYMGTGAAGCAFLVAWGMGWRSVKKGNGPSNDTKLIGEKDHGDVEGGSAGMVRDRVDA